MIWLVLGVALWSAAHLLKRLAPGLRAAMGDAGRAALALALMASVVLMVVGYRMADGAVFWSRTPMLAGINNLLMLVAVYMFAAAGMRTALARRMRHPMLGAVKLWALAHLLVNGDVPSLVLFGGLLAWAVAEVILINRAEPDWTPPPPAPARKEALAALGAAVVYAGIAAIHAWLGHPVFG
ncbi:MAG: NnrU family protein [Roseovarius sp.]